jgi:uncharacterized protein
MKRLRALWQICISLLIGVMIPLFICVGSATATGVYEIPPFQAGNTPWVLDQGNALSLLGKSSIEKKLNQLAQKTNTEVYFVTIRRFDYGDNAETFTNKLFERWFPTPELQTNRGLLLLDTQTHTTGIRVGEKIQTVMSNDIAKSIANETALVPIRSGNYNQGLLDAADRLVTVLSGEPDPGPPEIKVVEVESNFKKAKETNDSSASILVIVLVIVASVVPMATYFWYQRG